MVTFIYGDRKIKCQPLEILFTPERKACKQKYSGNADFWSKQSACAARAALQAGCVAKVVASINTVISLSSFSLSTLTFLGLQVNLGS
jgi:hypothetical protein